MSTLVFYMRSGNKIRLPNITGWEIKTTNSGKITGYNVEFIQTPGEQHLVNNSLDLTQIEAITEIPE